MHSIVDEKAFDSASEKTKLLLIYGMLKDLNVMIAEHAARQAENCGNRRGECDGRFLKIERRKILHTGLVVIGSFCGGLTAVGLKLRFWS